MRWMTRVFKVPAAENGVQYGVPKVVISGGGRPQFSPGHLGQ